MSANKFLSRKPKSPAPAAPQPARAAGALSRFVEAGKQLPHGRPCRSRSTRLRRSQPKPDRSRQIAALHCQLQSSALDLMARYPQGLGWSGGDRAAFVHARSISIYCCHVVLRMTMTEIAAAIGRHRSTIGYTCGRVEDRRDNPAFDRFVGEIEVLAGILHARSGGCNRGA